MDVKISARVLKKKRQNTLSKEKYLDQQWNQLLQPLINSLGNEEEVRLSVEFCHKTITDLHMMGMADELLSRVKQQISLYVKNKLDTAFSNFDKDDIDTVGKQILEQARKVRQFLTHVSVYFNFLTGCQSQNERHKLYQFGRRHLIELLMKDEEAVENKTELGAKLVAYLQKIRTDMTLTEQVPDWSHTKQILQEVGSFLEMIADEIPHLSVIRTLMSEGSNAMAVKTKEVVYTYAALFMQNALQPREIQQELYPTLLDLFENNCFKEIQILHTCCKQSGLSNDLLREWKAILVFKGKQMVDNILAEEKTQVSVSY